MSEHIKTGEEILETLQHGIEIQKRLNKKWVSLSWLQLQIQNEIDRRASIGYSSSGLDWVLHLLEG